MEIIRATHLLPYEELTRALTVLSEGKILCYPTETYYALGVDPWNPEARALLYSAKNRPAEKDLPLIAADAAMVQQFCDVSHPCYDALAAAFWPGPLTLVLPARDHSATYAIRVSSHEIARQLSLAFQKPIVSTSANQSGELPVREPLNLSDLLRLQISLLIDGGLTQGGQSSTILSLLEDSPRILREGAISSSNLLGIL